MDKKGISQGAILGIVLLGALILVGIYVFDNLSPTGNVARTFDIPTPKPKLSVSVTGGDTGFSITQGCKTTLQGSVDNYGDAEAQSVQVSCRLYGTKGQTTGTTSIGNIYQNGVMPFTINIDNDCPKPEDVDCTATCYNC